MDAAARFSDLYARYSADIYRFVLYLSGNRSIAEDVTAETFLRVWNAGRELLVATVKAYLLAIARNLYLRELRLERRATPLPDVLAAASSLQHDTELRADFDRVMAELQQLPEIDRAAVLLRAEDGLAYDEIARVLGISESAAKVKVHRARLRLAEARERSVTTT